MKSYLKNRKILAGAAMVATLLVMGLWPKSVPADIAPVERGGLKVTIDEEGETRVRDRFVVSAPVAGRALRIELEPGDSVKRGETVLATFRPGDPSLLDARTVAEAKAAVRAAEAAGGRAGAERQRAEATLELARSELQRHRELSAAQIVSREALEARQTEARSAAEGYRAAEFAVVSAEHQLAMARARLLQAGGGATSQVITLRSPIDGVVLRRLRESEALVPAGEPLLEIGNPRQLEIVADLLSMDAVRIEAGDPVLVERWGGETTLRARVRRVEPSGFTKISALGVEEQRVNVVMDFEDPVEAWQALGDGYRVEIRVVVWESEQTLKVPTSSLFRRPDAWAVFAVVDGRARLRSVEVGRRNGREAQVLSGLSAGDRVVMHPSDSIEPGSRLASRQESRGHHTQPSPMGTQRGTRDE